MGSVPAITLSKEETFYSPRSICFFNKNQLLLKFF